MSMMAANPSSPDVMFQIGVVNLAENKFKEAEDAFRKAYQLNPANSRGLMGIVETYMAQNRPDQALQVLQAEAQKMPDRMEFRLALGNTAVRAGKYDMAIAEFQAVLQKQDQKSRAAGDLYLRIGETQRRQGRPQCGHRGAAEGPRDHTRESAGGQHPGADPGRRRTEAGSAHGL